jgi:glycosyltransferase involved in cell wall biosynthesis
VPYEKLPGVLSLADVAFNSFEPILISNVAFPHKVLQYLATGIPTVSTKLEGLYSALGEDAGVIWVESPEQVFDAALKLKNLSKDEVNQIIDKGKNFIRKNFDQDVCVNRFELTIGSQIVERNE